MSGAKVEDVLWVGSDRAAEERVGFLRVKHEIDQICEVHGLELLVVGWTPVLALTDDLIAAAIFDDAFVDVGCDRGCVTDLGVSICR